MNDAPAVCFEWSKKRNPDFSLNKMPKIEDLDIYGKELMKWGRKLLRVKKKDADWSDIMKGTHTGFFTIVIGIAWLGHAQNGRPKVNKQLGEFLDEVQSSLKEMRASLEK
jgi:hypothetical protein